MRYPRNISRPSRSLELIGNNSMHIMHTICNESDYVRVCSDPWGDRPWSNSPGKCYRMARTTLYRPCALNTRVSGGEGMFLGLVGLVENGIRVIRVILATAFIMYNVDAASTQTRNHAPLFEQTLKSSTPVQSKYLLPTELN